MLRNLLVLLLLLIFMFGCCPMRSSCPCPNKTNCPCPQTMQQPASELPTPQTMPCGKTSPCRVGS